jgi:hypothetical protein
VSQTESPTLSARVVDSRLGQRRLAAELAVVCRRRAERRHGAGRRFLESELVASAGSTEIHPRIGSRRLFFGGG